MQFLILFLFFLQIASGVIFPIRRPVRVRGDITMRRPRFLRFPMRFIPLVGRVFRSRRLMPNSHIHIPLNGRQFEHSHGFSDVGHSHDTGFPSGVYPENGVGWNVPDEWRDANTWSMFDKVNPDSVLVRNNDLPISTPDFAGPSVPLFPDNIIPSDVEVPMVTSEFLPTSDKREEPVVTRPLTPITDKIDGSSLPGIFVNRDNINSTDTNRTQGNIENNTNTDLVQGSNTTTETKGHESTKTNEPSCHKTGCMTGHECVFSGSHICPIYIPEVDCKCRAGCRVDYTFIPYGTTVTMDSCGNTCSCFNMYGAPTCSNISCKANSQKLLPSGPTITPKENDILPANISTPQNPLPTPVNLDVTTKAKLENSKRKDSILMNFPVIPIVRDTQKS
ncbi:uncharacterized protein LOC133178339 [Saccostrea echinata]|uniref:uncharacterized protein LOC133178339 n=1 Tax=Saccostrea echinata TaxID=191078 RepID=UPI002A7FAB9E|nr:uncharacterized protein LOC133178339 [Saccostrea echinata]